MKLELTTKQFRRLLDMAYIGNWTDDQAIPPSAGYGLYRQLDPQLHPGG